MNKLLVRIAWCVLHPGLMRKILCSMGSTLFWSMSNLPMRRCRYKERSRGACCSAMEVGAISGHAGERGFSS